MHGDEGLVESLASCGVYEAIVRGHSHEGLVKKEERTLIINLTGICG